MSDIEEIKNRLDIVDVVSSYIKLQKAGVNFRANCPFHNEKTPSFFVSPARQTWHCFGACNEGGDVISFVQKFEGIEFIDALKILADRAGLQLKKTNPKLRDEKARLLELMKEAANFYENNLKTVKVAMDYLLKERGLTPEIIKEFRIGFAPARPNELFKYLIQIGFKPEEIEKTGLIIKKNQASGINYQEEYFDRFRSRIIFPINNSAGAVIAFGGRIFELPGVKYKSEMSKYINSPETILYSKSRTLYNLDKAKLDIRKNDACILAEGYFDAIASYQAGIKNIVAVSGTALTENHLQIIKRYTKNLLTSFDADLAGQNAARRGIDLAQKMDFDVRVIRISKGKDPADVVKESPQKWLETVKNSVDIMDFYIETAFANNDSASPKGKKAIINLILPIVKNIPSAVVQSHWINILAQKLGVKEEMLWNDLERIKTALEYPDSHSGEAIATEESLHEADADRLIKLEERLLGFLKLHPEYLQFVSESNFLPSIHTAEIFNAVKENLPLSGEQSLKLNHAVFQAEIFESQGNIEVEEEIKVCLANHNKLQSRMKCEEIELKIKEAEAKGEHKEAERLIEEYNKIVKN